MSTQAVWIVDDDDSIRWVLTKALARTNLPTRSFSQIGEVLHALNEDQPKVLVSDIRMQGGSGLDLLHQIKQRMPDLPVIIMTAFSDLETTVAAFQGGAFEYLSKPFDLDKAVALIQRALSETERTVSVPEVLTEAPEIIGTAPVMQDLFRAIGRLSQSHVTVLITGESGSGKELVARALHKHSPRARQAFVALNTAAIPKDLLESELFGHEKGAFTGAQAMRRGRFEQAEGGTLFLDEIGDMPLDLQTRLLRVLSDGHYYRVGGHQPLKADVRVIAATHQNLEARVKEGLFREDLYHRLNVIRLRLPSLRERKEDIPELTRFFLAQSARQLAVEQKRMSDEAMQWIATLDFPGNVRQLENLCNWITVMAPGQVVELRDLPDDIRHTGLLNSEPAQKNATDTHITANASASAITKPISSNPSNSTMGSLSWDELLEHETLQLLNAQLPDIMAKLNQKFEAAVIQAALRHTQGRKNDAAQKLGIGRNTIARKAQELGLSLRESSDAMESSKGI